MSPAAITDTGRGPTLATGGHYSAECVEEEFCELRTNGVLGSWRGVPEGSIMHRAGYTRRPTRRPMKKKEALLVSEEPPPTNNGIPEETPTRQDVDVLLDVQELEVDKIHLTVRGLRAHVSVVAELASLVNLQVGVDARLDEVELEIEGVRAKLLLKVRLDNIRAILEHALDTVAENPQILRVLTRALDELVSGTLGGALGALENVLEDLEVGGTVDELLRGRLENVRDTLQEILDQVGDRAQEAAKVGTSPALPEGSSSSSTAADEPSGPSSQEEED